MFQGNVKGTLHVLNENGSRTGQLLLLSSHLSESYPSLRSVHDAVLSKHPDPGLISPSHSLLSATPPTDHDPHSVLF